MILLDNQIHQIIRDHPVLTALRNKAKRGKEVIVYRHAYSGNFILAETNGRITRELAVLSGWPRIPEQRMRELATQLRPLPGTVGRKNKMVKDSLDEKANKQRDLGRFRRELQARIRSKVRGQNKDHPSLVWPKIPGEGV